MRFSTLALAGLFGGLLLVGDASACHKKKTCACPPPVPVVTCAPAPVKVKVACAPKPKHACKMPKLTMHHKKACAPVAYAAPVVHPTSQSAPTPQAM